MARRKEPQIPDAILDQLLSGTAASAAFDQGGLLDRLKKALAERALNAEMDHHLAGDGGAGNSRNGYGRKSVLTDTGRMALEVPRDRPASFDPQLIAKYQRRFPGFDDKIISMYARGMSTREIAGHLQELYGIEVSPDLISDGHRRGAGGDRRPGRPGRWSRSIRWSSSMRCGSRSATRASSATRPCYIALGVRPDGTKEILGLWIEQTEGAKFWLRVMNELQQPRRRGHPDRRRRWPEGLSRGDHRGVPRGHGADLHRPSAPPHPGFRLLEGPQAGRAGAEGHLPGRRRHRRPRPRWRRSRPGPWGQKYAAIGQSWRRAWGEVIPFYAFPDEVRRILYTTNAIEALNAKLRRAVRARGHFPTDEAAMKLLFLVLNRTEKEWKMPPREWSMAKAQFAVLFGERFTKAMA